MRQWNAISSFAHNLGVKKEIIEKAERAFNEFLKEYYEIREFVWENHRSKWNESLSIQTFHSWDVNLYCFFELILSGCRHVALRELRYYLECSARSYYVDSNHQEMSYNCKVPILKEVRWKKFKELIKSIKEKRKELVKFYDELCAYVHLSEETQTDATRDADLNRALGLPLYEEGIRMLKKTFEYSHYLLLQSLEKKSASAF